MPALPRISRMLTIVRKELLVLLDNRQSRIMLIVPPLMQIIIFAWAATMEVRNVDVAVLNRDAGLWSREIVHRVEGSPTFASVFHLQGEAELKPTLDSRKALLVLVFNEDFSRAIARGDTADMQILLDGRRSNAAQISANYLNQIVQGVAAATPRALGVSQVDGALGASRPAPQGAPSPAPPQASSLAGASAPAPQVSIAARFWFNPNLEFQWFFLPNLIGMLSFMLGLVVTGLSVAREREVGTFDQLLVSPATPLEIALAKLAPGCLVGLVHGTIFLGIAHFGFGVPVVGSLPLLYVAMFIFSLSAGGMGLMVSSLSSTQQQAFLGAFTVGVPCILISGATTPLENMPAFLQAASQFNPLRHFIVITQGVFLKDMTVQAAAVSLLKIIAIAAVSVSVAIWMFKRRT